MTENLVHVWESNGFGRAPFAVVGCYEDRGPKTIPGTIIQVGSPGQPMGTCRVCGNGIAMCFVIRSADGREFTVGSDCVMKAGDGGLRRRVNELRAERRREARREAAAAAAERALAAQREKNGGRTDAELEAERRAERQREASARSEWLWRALLATSSSWAHGVAENLKAGIETLEGLSSRCVDICREIYAKRCGRRGSAAYKEAEYEFESKLAKAVGRD